MKRISSHATKLISRFLPVVIFSFILILLLFNVFGMYNADKLHYQYVGSYNYEILNDSLDNCYLSPNSYGYIIGDLNLDSCGIKILHTGSLDKSDEYIISFNHPVKSIYNDSDRIRGEGQEHMKKQPLDIILDTSKTTDSIYIYRLEPKGKYRLLLP